MAWGRTGRKWVQGVAGQGEKRQAEVELDREGVSQSGRCSPRGPAAWALTRRLSCSRSAQCHQPAVSVPVRHGPLPGGVVAEAEPSRWKFPSLCTLNLRHFAAASDLNRYCRLMWELVSLLCSRPDSWAWVPETRSWESQHCKSGACPWLPWGVLGLPIHTSRGASGKAAAPKCPFA